MEYSSPVTYYYPARMTAPSRHQLPAQPSLPSTTTGRSRRIPDLRRRYGERYRIVRADSGADALDALREMSYAATGRDHPRRLPDAAHERHRIPRAGDGPLPDHAPGAAHRLRRHRRRHRRDQCRRPRLLPAQALDPPEEKLYPVVDSCSRPGRPPITAAPRDQGHRATDGRRARRSCASSSPATRCPTAVPVRRAGGRAAAHAAAWTSCTSRSWSRGRAHPGRAQDAEVASQVGWPQADVGTSTTCRVGAPAGSRCRPCTASEAAHCWSERIATGGRRAELEHRELPGFPDACPARSSPTGPAPGDRFAPSCFTTREVVALEACGSARKSPSPTRCDRRAHRHPRHRRDLPAVGRSRRRDLTGGVFYVRPSPRQPAAPDRHLHRRRG